LNQHPQGVPSPPNRCVITGRIVSKHNDPHFSEKWLYEVEVAQVEPMSGPSFAQPGQTVSAFCVRPTVDVQVGDSIVAEAEFIGGPVFSQGAAKLTGTFQLLTMRPA